ncbi:MAG: DUF6702 family protein [Gammaproteobacteria bacterium]
MTRDPSSRRRGLRTFAALAVAVVIGLGSVAEAHRSHVTLTRVALNSRSGSLEIVHAIHYHDALRLLAVLGVPDSVQPTSTEGRARIALEIEKEFRWLMPQGRVATPVTLGAELEGDNLIVYQELRSPVPGRWSVESSFMHRVFEDQTNRILLEYAMPMGAITLSRTSPKAEFDGPRAARDGG